MFWFLIFLALPTRDNHWRISLSPIFVFCWFTHCLFVQNTPTFYIPTFTPIFSYWNISFYFFPSSDTYFQIYFREIVPYFLSPIYLPAKGAAKSIHFSPLLSSLKHIHFLTLSSDLLQGDLLHPAAQVERPWLTPTWDGVRCVIETPFRFVSSRNSISYGY